VAWVAIEAIMERIKTKKQVSETTVLANLQLDVIDLDL